MKLGEHWDKDPRLKQWFHRLDAVIILLLLAGIAWFRLVALERKSES